MSGMRYGQLKEAFLALRPAPNRGETRVKIPRDGRDKTLIPWILSCLDLLPFFYFLENFSCYSCDGMLLPSSIVAAARTFGLLNDHPWPEDHRQC